MSHSTPTAFVSDRRAFLKTSMAVGLASALPISYSLADSQRVLDFSDPYDNAHGFIKMYSDTAGSEVYTWFGGDVSAIVGSKAPQPILGYEGFAVNRSVYDGKGGYRIFINEVAFYKDLETDEIIDVWVNPFTQERVDVWHAHAGPLTNTIGPILEVKHMDGSIEENPFILPWSVIGDDVFMGLDWMHARDNPLTPSEWPRESTGLKVRTLEAIQYMAKLSDLYDDSITQVKTLASWSLLRAWHPWMLMGQSKGHLWHRSQINKLDSMEKVPERLLRETEKRFPYFLTAPADDTFGERMNSFKIFQKERSPMPPKI